MNDQQQPRFNRKPLYGAVISGLIAMGGGTAVHSASSNPCAVRGGGTASSFGELLLLAASCNPCNPCAACNPCNPCAGACNPCATCNPCNPCAGACNPCNPCAVEEEEEENPCNPCAAESPCNPCATCNPCNPCTNACNSCNPCAAACNPCAGASNPCNPCAACSPCNPCAANPCNPCSPCARMPCNPCAAACNPCNPCGGAAVQASDFKRPGGGIVQPEMRDDLIAYGEKLWNDTSLSTNGLACQTCHMSYGALNPTFAEPYPHRVAMPAQMAGVQEVSAEEMVQFCMLVPMQSETFAWNSKELAALASYTVALQAGFNPCGAAANPCNPCAGACNPCAAANPCNPCAACNPCAVEEEEENPCNPCAGACNPCNPCASACNPCNPCAVEEEEEENPCNPCNPCASENPCQSG